MGTFLLALFDAKLTFVAVSNVPMGSFGGAVSWIPSVNSSLAFFTCSFRKYELID
jgi:hypothetical protein